MAAVPRLFFGRFFGKVPSDAAGFAIGGAIAGTLRPQIQDIQNAAWARHPARPVDAGLLAAGVAQGQVDYTWAWQQAEQTGIKQTSFDKMVEIANTGPGVPAAFDLWRRELLTDQEFRDAAKRQGLEKTWIDALFKTKDVLLDESVIANAVQQGHMPTEGLLPAPVTGDPPYNIPLTQIDLSPTEEAQHQGITKKRLEIAANLVGLPPGDHEMLDMWNRGIITEASVNAGIREGHRKTKWIPAVKELRWAVLTAVQAANLHLRGWISPEKMYEHGAKVGYDKPMMDLIFKGQGRPLSWHQIWIGLQRGGVYDGPTDQINKDFLTGLKQSSIRPEWFNLAWAQRYTYPSAFVLRALTQDGTLTAAQAEQDLLDMGWRPTRAKQAATKWAAPTGAAGDTHVAKARQQLWTTTHRSFLNAEADEPTVRQRLALVGVPTAEQDAIIEIWTMERVLVRRQLTPAQIKKAYLKNVVNPATGAAWTRDDAIGALIELGYASPDAGVFLDTV